VHAGSGPSSRQGQPAGHDPRCSPDLNEPTTTTMPAAWACDWWNFSFVANNNLTEA